MRTTIDNAGRIVIPKALRDAMGLTGGSAIDVAFVDGRIEIELAPAEYRLERHGRLMVAVPVDPDAPPFTDEIIRETLEATRQWPR